MAGGQGMGTRGGVKEGMGMGKGCRGGDGIAVGNGGIRSGVRIGEWG